MFMGLTLYSVLLTASFPVAFISMKHLTKTLDMPSCPAVNGENPNVTGVDKHVHMRSGASFASVLMRVHHKCIDKFHVEHLEI